MEDKEFIEYKQLIENMNESSNRLSKAHEEFKESYDKWTAAFKIAEVVNIILIVVLAISVCLSVFSIYSLKKKKKHLLQMSIHIQLLR